MDAYETILTRRSIRDYTEQPVTETLITDLLKAAMAAPSAGNRQPWHFVVITDRGTLDALTGILPNGQMLKKAPLAIVVCGNRQQQLYEDYWVQDCSAATENILLAAHDRGLGAVWLGVYPRPERVQGVSELLGLPEPVKPLCVIAIGYPAEQKPPSDRYDAARVHRNRW